jgi:hypothetical protein
MLTYPGGGLPTLGSVVSGTSQSFSSSSLSPYFLSSVTNNSNGFGSAATEVYVANSGQQGSFTTKGGVYWSLKTQLADNLGGTSNEASVMFATATAVYYNNTGASLTITPGAILSINGVLGGDTSDYIAAGLATTIATGVSPSSLGTPTALDSVILAASGAGVNIAATGGRNGEFGSVTVASGLVTGTGTSLATTMTIANGTYISITSYLTLISDPDSMVGISADLPQGLTAVPDFGSFASSPSVATPEPSSLVLLGSGLALAGLWSRSNRRRSPAKA